MYMCMCAHSIRTSAPKRLYVQAYVCAYNIHLKAYCSSLNCYRCRTCIQWAVPFPCQIQRYERRYECARGLRRNFLLPSSYGCNLKKETGNVFSLYVYIKIKIGSRILNIKNDILFSLWRRDKSCFIDNLEFVWRKII